MEPIYRYSESTRKPLSVEFAKHTVFLRTNIEQKKRTDSFGNTTTYWVYQEAKMTKKEFSEYSNLVASTNAINGMHDSDNIAQIKDGQTNGDNNQMIIMEAIADLYDIIASKM